MDLNKELQFLKIDVVKKTVFIQNKTINFSYTPAKNILKDEFKEKYRYFGGLQCNFEDGSKDYITLENKLCEISEALLAVL